MHAGYKYSFSFQQLVLSCIFLGVSAIITAASLIFIILRIIRRPRHPAHGDTQFRYVLLIVEVLYSSSMSIQISQCFSELSGKID